MLSIKFPHLFLRPEIIITFLWGWEWSGGQVRHRFPRNSGILFLMENPLANNEDPDQKPHDIASDLGLHFLPMTLCGFPTKL